jgi:hypothetical protein
VNCKSCTKTNSLPTVAVLTLLFIAAITDQLVAVAMDPIKEIITVIIITIMTRDTIIGDMITKDIKIHVLVVMVDTKAVAMVDQAAVMAVTTLVTIAETTDKAIVVVITATEVIVVIPAASKVIMGIKITMLVPEVAIRTMAVTKVVVVTKEVNRAVDIEAAVAATTRTR